MAPVDRRRRRRRRLRPRATAAGLAVAAVLVVAVLVGGLLKMGSQSAPYWRSVDRSYALGARPVVGQSNRCGARLATLVAGMTRDSRLVLQADLDTLVRTSRRIAEEAATLGEPSPYGGAGAAVTSAMAARAQAVAAVRHAVDGLLRMAPLPVAGSAAAQDGPPGALDVAGATRELARAGALLVRADRQYAGARRALRSAPGGARLPGSVWTGRTAVWRSGGAPSLAAALAAAPSLAPVHDVELVTDAVALTPAPVPPAPGAAGGTTLPPTGSVTLSAVVANKGNVAERGVVLTARLAAAGGRRVTTRSRPFSLGPLSSLAVALRRLGVVPGGSYTLTVSVALADPDARGAVTTDTVTFGVAPPGPPTVSQVLPKGGRAAGGNDVTILGSGFTWVRSVRFGHHDAHFHVVSSTQITAVAPPGSGTVDVKVLNAGGVSPAATTARYTYRQR